MYTDVEPTRSQPAVCAQNVATRFLSIPFRIGRTMASLTCGKQGNAQCLCLVRFSCRRTEMGQFSKQSHSAYSCTKGQVLFGIYPLHNPLLFAQRTFIMFSICSLEFALQLFGEVHNEIVF